MTERSCDKCGSLMELADYTESGDMVYKSSEKSEDGAKYFYIHTDIHESIWVCICGNKKIVRHSEEDEPLKDSKQKGGTE